MDITTLPVISTLLDLTSRGLLALTSLLAPWTGAFAGALAIVLVTLVVRAAITGVSAKAEGLKAYEVIPIALVVAATTTAAGTRDRETEIFVEAEMLDGSTGQPVMRVVRKGRGQELENREEQVTLATLKSVIDTIVNDIERFQD